MNQASKKNKGLRANLQPQPWHPGPRPPPPSAGPEAARGAREDPVVPAVAATRHPSPRPRGPRPAGAQLGSRPVRPGPAAAAAASPAGRGRDVMAASWAPAAGTRRASLKRHRGRGRGAGGARAGAQDHALGPRPAPAPPPSFKGRGVCAKAPETGPLWGARTMQAPVSIKNIYILKFYFRAVLAYR